MSTNRRILKSLKILVNSCSTVFVDIRNGLSRGEHNKKDKSFQVFRTVKTEKKKKVGSRLGVRTR